MKHMLSPDAVHGRPQVRAYIGGAKRVHEVETLSDMLHMEFATCAEDLWGSHGISI